MGTQTSCCHSADKDKDRGDLALAKTSSVPEEGKPDADGVDAEPAAFSATEETVGERGTKSEPAAEGRLQKTGEPAAGEPSAETRADERSPAGSPSDAGQRASPPVLLSRHEVAVFVSRAPEATIGLNLDALEDNATFVDGVLKGAIQSWNESHPNDAHLKQHDRIVAINGVRGTTNLLLSEMRKTVDWSLVVQRPQEIQLSVDCEKNPTLGLDLKYSPNGVSLLISSIGDGAIKEYNRTTSGTHILPNDRIIEVNGVRGTAKRLLEAATNVDTLHLAILHFEK